MRREGEYTSILLLLALTGDTIPGCLAHRTPYVTCKLDAHCVSLVGHSRMHDGCSVRRWYQAR